MHLSKITFKCEDPKMFYGGFWEKIVFRGRGIFFRLIQSFLFNLSFSKLSKCRYYLIMQLTLKTQTSQSDQVFEQPAYLRTREKEMTMFKKFGERSSIRLFQYKSYRPAARNCQTFLIHVNFVSKRQGFLTSMKFSINKSKKSGTILLVLPGYHFKI